MTRPATFRQSDIARAIKAVQATGLPVEGVEIVDGCIRVLTKATQAPKALDAFEQWERSQDGERAA